MFEFLMDVGNYEGRKVAKTEFEWGYISTCRVSDGSQPYETAIKSNEYASPDDPDNKDNMIIVEAYDSEENAQTGHNKWRDIMENNPPQELVDCCNAGVAELINALSEAPREVRV